MRTDSSDDSSSETSASSSDKTSDSEPAFTHRGKNLIDPRQPRVDEFEHVRLYRVVNTN